MLTKIREYLPLKTILFSILVLILSANSPRPSSSSPDSSSDVDFDDYGDKNFSSESDSHIDVSVLAKPSYGVLVVSNSSSPHGQQDNEETFCIVHYNEEHLPKERKDLILQKIIIWNDTNSLCTGS